MWIASYYACHVSQVWRNRENCLLWSTYICLKCLKRTQHWGRKSRMSPRLEADLSLEERSCCCVQGWPDPLTWPRLPPSTDPEQISTGNKRTYSPDTFCRWAITWQDTVFVFGVSRFLIWTWIRHWGYFVVFASMRRKYCGIWKQTLFYSRLPFDILGVGYFRPLWDVFWGRKVCYWGVAPCRPFGKPETPYLM